VFTRSIAIILVVALTLLGAQDTTHPANEVAPPTQDGAPAAADPNAAAAAAQAAAPQGPPAVSTKDLAVTVGKSLIVDSPVNIQRVSVANGDLAEAVAITPKEVLVNGKAPGETSLIIWQQGGNRLFYDLTVRQSTSKIDAVRQEIQHELPGQEISVNWENDTAFISGRVKDLTSADRVVAIASTLGKVVNLLHVTVPPVEAQILLKVRFANVDRSASLELGANLYSTGATNTIGSTGTGQFAKSQVGTDGKSATFTLSDALNVFLFRPDLNLGATIRALQSRSLLEILAEPNVLAINGKAASFVAGGEFPFPTLQGGGGGLGAVTIAFREFGVRINFLPTVTPRGTIRLHVMPEVSSLDFAHGLVFQGFSIPALATRRVQTEVELESGQSFAIGGLLDNRLTETLEKIPGLSNIPLLGKLFQSKQTSKQNSELLVIVTPELVRPIPQGQPLPAIEFPKPVVIDGVARTTVPRTPGMETTGPVPHKSETESVPVEQLMEMRKAGQPTQTQQPIIQLVPMTPFGPPLQNPNGLGVANSPAGPPPTNVTPGLGTAGK
jgi:pilus assembly protein CpaC